MLREHCTHEGGQLLRGCVHTDYLETFSARVSGNRAVKGKISLPCVMFSPSELSAGPPVSDEAQLITNIAGFHFATVEHEGSTSLLLLFPTVNLQVLRMITVIGGTEIRLFEI